jgi:predicted ribosome quality control (RQC) complex YloA/Tae2 family protein
MLLRKHLTGGTVLNVEQYQMDRVLFIDISSIDELGQPSERRLVVEIMGKHSNIILINKDSNKIIDSIKRVTHDMSRVRQVLPGINYEYPPIKDKKNPLDFNTDEFNKLLDECNSNIETYKFFYTNYIGISPLIGKEVCFNSRIDIDRPIGSLNLEEKKSLLNSFITIMDKVKNDSYNPVLIKNNFEADYLDFHATDINQFGNQNKVYLNSISEVLDKYYLKNDTLDRVSQKSQSIKKSIQTKLERSLNKLSKQKQELLESEDRGKYKVYADLISANLYRIEKGSSEIELENFYTENMEKIKVPLDKRHSPAENAQRYYKKYSKLKHAQSLLLKQIPETKEEIDYLENVLISIDNCTEVIELDEIKEELIKEGYLKGNLKKKKKKEVISKPHHYISSDGFHIYVGKNNKQNDYLTLRFAHKEDLWLHIQNQPGSHVIITKKNNSISDTSLEEAATLAAYYSKGKNSSNVAIDYTERKNVKKPKNAKTGMVIYENFNTIFVTPSKEQIEKMEKVED